MTVNDVFHIKGRGTVVTGRLEGSGLLGLGDTLLCDGRQWQVSGLERFRASLVTAEPGQDIGVLLANGPPGDALRGRTVQFASGAGPELGPQVAIQPQKQKRWRR